MLRLYNTMTRRNDPFQPLEDGKVGLYTCGPTVYNFAHLGNLRTYLFEDYLRRVLELDGYEVTHVMNVTDVGHLVSDSDTGEDKMAVGAAREGVSAYEIADRYWQAFRDDLKRLHILEPSRWCKATDHIQEQIDLASRLEEAGFTYHIDDGIYFDTKKLVDYGKLARLDLDSLKAGARIEVVKGKRNPTDFAVWKFSPKNESRLMEWDSPWGIGFPGWHLECSAMSLRYLGEQFDIHCGGIDHVAVHHTNEIAQVEAVTGKEWVRWWMHGEFLVLPKSADGEDGERMSKSGDNFLTVNTLVQKGFDPVAYRFFCLGAHYRAPLTFTWESIEGAANALERIANRVAAIRDETGGRIAESYYSSFLEACRDDLNMPRALAVLWAVLGDKSLSGADQYTTLLEMDRVFGIGIKSMTRKEAAVDTETQKLVDARIKARADKNFAEADRIRDLLSDRGFVLEDTADGTIVRPK